MAEATPSIEENISTLENFGVDGLDRNEIRQLLLV
jgi:hypothetical protein